MVAFKTGTRSSRRRLRSQLVSATALATPRYSASALDQEMVGWRFEDQEMRLSPVKMQYPDVDLRESGQPPQSASE
ncbi:hypothetical protein HanIR_Chr13g0641831 [Helianthus annuus]|nr:hypothetical protein HanIR_Chr13g0641831 [Helianthus annuus]